MKINRRKLALVSAMPIFAAASIWLDAWNDIDLGREYDQGAIAYTEYAYAAAKGTTVAAIRAEEKSASDRNFKKCRADHGLSQSPYIVTTFDPCGYYPSILAMPRNDTPTFLVGIAYSLLSLLPLLAILVGSITISFASVFGMPAGIGWFIRWIQT
ncbi:hypothetical protein Rhsp01_01550 [Rhizobium sp. NBRC 114257]|uniref:Uncharacterized protein n=1 Tax=Rhizobium dioscoreae TaxID=2653122 RepID=A0ABQ0YZB7_9HYPH|nr:MULTISPECIES: hypothetical protein [Rhizobium]GES48552.1 hypothetical protein RsS93_11660 [Rhizobium dioscoreae]GLU78979.1 hypothetical protein Rhsp01_01550 [Rhizobium sp. NBRC 114257]